MVATRFNFTPDLIKDDTQLAARGHYVGMQWMRWRYGAPENILGWQAASLVDLVTGTASYVVATDGTIPGITRRLNVWFDTSGNGYIGAGGSSKLAVLYGGGLYDITPFASTATYSNPFVVTSGSPIVTVALGTILHSATDGQTVVFSNSGTVGGIVPNGPWVLGVVNTSTFTFTYTNGSATAAGTGGGTAVVAEYELPPGNVNGLGGPGYGVGGDGLGFFGVSSANVAYPRTWSLANLGQYLLANPRSGLIYEWQLNTAVRAQPLANAPSVVTYMFVTAETFVVAAGAHDGSGFDPMLVRWSDQAIDTVWTPAVTNQAGDYRLGEGSRIVAGMAAARESLIFTDRALYAMRPLADNSLVYGFVLLGTGCGLIGPNAVALVGGNAYWLSNNGEFWIYDGGAPRPLPSGVISYVFNAITLAQQEKIYACRNGLNDEIWWLYPADDDPECSNYVGHNYKEGGWFAGTIARTAMVDAGIEQYPVMAGTDSRLYLHEIGTSADGAAIEANLLSAPFDLADGQALVEVLGLLPDFKDQTTTLQVSIITRDQAQSTEETDGPYMVGTSGARIDTRASGRQAQILWERNDSTGTLNIGVTRLDIQPLGERQ